MARSCAFGSVAINDRKVSSFANFFLSWAKLGRQNPNYGKNKAVSVAVNESTDPMVAGSETLHSSFLLVLTNYLGYLNASLSPEDLVAGLPVGMADFRPEDARRALARIGYVAEFKKTRDIPKGDLPICAKMKDGSHAILLRMEDEEVTLAHPGLEAGTSRQPLRDFLRAYDGEYLIAAPTVEALEGRHVGPIRRGHWFWSQLTQQRWVTFEIFLATLVANALAVAVSLFALQVYDRVIPNASFQTLWVLAVGAGVAIVFEALLRIARGRLIDDLGRAVEVSVGAHLASKLQGMRLGDRTMGPAALGSLMRDFASVREFFTATAVGSVVDIPFVVIFLALIFAIAGPVVYVVMTAMVVIIVLSLLARRVLSRISEDMQGANSAQSRLLNEMTYGAEEIKLNRAENRFQQAWEDTALLISAKTQSQRATSGVLSFASQGIQQAAYILAVVTGVYMVLDGAFSIGAIIAVSILSSRAIAPVTQLSGAISRWQQVRVALDGLGMIADAPQERRADRQYARRDVMEGRIEITDLRFRYAEDQDEVLNIAKLAMEPAKTVAVLGRNGSGKSTLLKMLSGLYAFEHGEIRIDGLEIRQIDPTDLRRNVGVLSQDITLFSGTLRDNLLLSPAPKTDADLTEALAFSGLDQVVGRHPMGLDMPVLDGGMGLSVGQRQSLGLARLYLADPQVVLLDEPTAALDQTLEAQMIAKLRDWLVGRTCVLTTHRTEILSLCDRIAVLENGKLVMEGKTAEVLSVLTKNSQKKVANA